MAMAKIVPTHPYLVAEYQEMIISSINDQDISIRMRALDLVSAMVCGLSEVLPTCTQPAFIVSGEPGQSTIHHSATPLAPSAQR